MENSKRNVVYGGLSHVEMADVEFDLGDNVFIRKTFAHLFAPFMMAFKPPGKYGHHDGPWKAAKGGFGFDILVEIEMPEVEEFKSVFDKEEMIWIIASLIRISWFPYAGLSAYSDISFNNVLENNVEPILIPVETKGRIFVTPENNEPILTTECLQWLKESWQKTARLLKENPKFYSAYKAFDMATIEGNTSSALLMVWGAIEQLFSPNTGELKYRVSANLSSFLTEKGDERLELFKQLSKLYNERSTVAHTSKQADKTSLFHSYVHLRNALIKIIEDGKIPSQEDLEKLIFSK